MSETYMPSAPSTRRRTAPDRSRERLISRAAPASLFTLLLYYDLQSFVVRVHEHPPLLREAGRASYLLFVALWVLFTVIRPSATAVDRRPTVALATFIGAFGLAVSPLVFPNAGVRLFYLGRLGGGLEAVMSLAGLGAAIATLSFLGRSFSLIPQAHRLVTGGPYRLVRHPLYVCEAIAMLGGIVASGRVDAMVIFAVVMGAQVVRMHYEEALLRETFPDYDEQFAGVAHLIPGVW